MLDVNTFARARAPLFSLVSRKIFFEIRIIRAPLFPSLRETAVARSDSRVFISSASRNSRKRFLTRNYVTGWRAARACRGRIVRDPLVTEGDDRANEETNERTSGADLTAPLIEPAKSISAISYDSECPSEQRNYRDYYRLHSDPFRREQQGRRGRETRG